MSFRIAIGQCNCNSPYTDAIQRFACDAIDAQLQEWRSRLPADLSSIPREAFDAREIDGLRVVLGVHREDIEGGGSLVVFQVFVYTWTKPTYLAIGKVGRIYAEGLLISPEGDVGPAPNELMWQFR